MKSILFVLFGVLAVCLANDEPEIITDIARCHCNPNFEARLTSTTGYKCFGQIKKIIVPCNTIARPRCVCTDSTGILTDENGTYCTRYAGGKELQRWNCENTEDWANYFVAHPDAKPKPL